MKSMICFWSLLVISFGTIQARAMNAEATRVVLYVNGETIFGEEFVAANEGVVDYLATLQRPTQQFQGLKYDCMAKSRLIEPYVQHTGGNTNYDYVDVLTVYDLSGCTQVK